MKSVPEFIEQGKSIGKYLFYIIRQILDSMNRFFVFFVNKKIVPSKGYVSAIRCICSKEYK